MLIALYWQRRIRKGRSENGNQLVVLDDPSFFVGEMDGFVTLEVLEDYDLEGNRNWCRWTSSEEENERTVAAEGELLRVL